MENERQNKDPEYIIVIGKLINVIIILLIVIVILIVINMTGFSKPGNAPQASVAPLKETPVAAQSPEKKTWLAPDTSGIKNEANAALIYYGKELVVNTSFYFGPHGLLATSANGMNCQNCHLEAGTKPFGNNYSAVASTYPKFRARSGSIESIHKRVNDCFERSLNGKALDTSGKEMQAIVSYIRWLGKEVAKGEKPHGAGLTELAFMQRAADPDKGEAVYLLKCKSCHLESGEGKLNADGITYQYPPLWGAHSYNTGAGLFRLSRFAGYVKSNMPQGATYKSAQLSDEEAWDVAAFVNSRPRPVKDVSRDWPEMSAKPVDHPFGPYADGFPEQQHKYGPFEPIALAQKK